MAFSNYPCYNKFKKSCMDCPSCPTGPTGPIGPIGPAGGPTGPSQWFTDTIIGPTGPGYTGTGYTGIGYTGDVIVRGNLYVEGGIDPTYLAFTPGPIGPQGFINPLWLDTSNNLRSEQILLDDGVSLITNTLTNTQIKVIDNDPGLSAPFSTTITEVGVAISNSNLDVTTLNAVGLSIYNGNNSNVYTVGINSGADFLISTAGNDRLMLNSSINESIWGTLGVLTHANITLNSGGACRADIDTRLGSFSVGDIAPLGNGTTIVLDDAVPSISSYVLGENNNSCNAFKITGLSTGNNMNFNDTGNEWTCSLSGGNNITFTQGDGRFRVGDVAGVGNGMLIDLDYVTGFSVYTGVGTASVQRYSIGQTGLQTWQGGMGYDNVNNILSFGKPQFAFNYSTSGGTLSANSPYAQTINGTGQTLTLPLVTSGNVGIQFLITNTNASALTVNSSSSQLIYSSTGAASTLTRSLAVGHSHIFTAIFTTSVSTYGWSMV